MSNNVVYGITIRADGTAEVVRGAGEIRTAFGSVESGTNAATAGADRLAAALGRVAHYGTAYLGLSQLQAFSQEVMQAQVATERFSNLMQIATGSAAAGAVEYDYVRRISQRLGIELSSTADAYAKFAAAARGTALQGEGARQVFEAVAGVSAKMGMSVADQQGVFLALSQMMSKGVVSAEEFRQQLGERLPIATTAGAAALGVTQQKFMELLNSGKLVSEDFLPKFADQLNKLGGATGQVEGLQASLNRLSNNWTAIKQELADGAPMQGTADAIAALTSHTQALAAAITTVGVAGLSAGLLKLGDAGRIAIVSALDQRAANISAAQAEVTRAGALVALRDAQLAEAQASVAAASGMQRLTLVTSTLIPAQNAATVATTELAAAQTASAGASGIARGALAMLGGPIGAISLLLGVGAAAWLAWGDNAKSALDTALEKAKELERAKQKTGLAGAGEDPAVKELADLEAGLAAKRGALNDAQARLNADRKNGVSLTSLLFGQDGLEVGALRSDVALAEKIVADKRAEIEARAKAGGGTPPPKSPSSNNWTAPNSALESMQMDAVKSSLDASGLSASAAAEQVKVYLMALKGAHDIEKLMAENKPKEAAALRAKLDVELEAAQMLPDSKIALDRETEDKKKADKASHVGVQLMGKLDAESAGAQAIADANTLSDPALQGNARIEAERAIAQASEDAKYQIKAEALAREWELMANDGTLTEQNAAIQAKRMEKLEEDHQGKLKAIQLKAGADKRKNELDIVSFTNSVKAGEYSSAMGFAMKMTAGLASHSRAAFEVNKAASISKAVMDTYKGVGGVLAEFPGPVGWAMAAVQTAMGIAQVNAINATQFGGGSTTASVGAGGGIPSLSTSVGTPVSIQPEPVPATAPAQGTVAVAPREVNIVMTGGQNFYSADAIRNLLIPALNDAVGDGVTINVVGA